MNLLLMLRFPFLDKIYLPFKVYGKARIKILSSSLNLSSRIILGNNPKLPSISTLPVNLFFGLDSIINFGSSISIGPGMNIIVKENAELSIGDNTYFTSDSHIEVVNSLAIGKNCAISWGVSIIDDDHHEIKYTGKKDKEKSIKIGDDVWIGCNVTILKGSRIGNSSVVSAGSVLTGKEYPPNSLIAGNPAKVIKSNVRWS